MKRTRILLGIDFIGANFPSARQTIQQWWPYVNESEEHDCILGVSNFCAKDSHLPGGKGLLPTSAVEVLSSSVDKKKLAHWTSDIDSILLETIRGRFESQPFFSDFNYGSVVNRLLLLAHSHACDYMVRIDPGTLPPQGEGASFAKLMSEHESEIGKDPRAVVSRQYANRLALRHMFVKSGQEKFHAKLVEDFTGIDVQCQITGGAMLTLRSPGTPAVCFPKKAGLTLVWASDDGIYQLLPDTQAKSHPLKNHPVERFDEVGKRKKSTEYYRGIIGAAYLNAMRTVKNKQMAKQHAKDFVRDLKDKILDATKCDKLDKDIDKDIDKDSDWATRFRLEHIAPLPFLRAIEAGHANHIRLLTEWGGICEALKSLVAEKTIVRKN